jgi:hypothetical protein
LSARGEEPLGEVVRYDDAYGLCYLHGPEGTIIMLAEQIG